MELSWALCASPALLEQSISRSRLHPLPFRPCCRSRPYEDSAISKSDSRGQSKEKRLPGTRLPPWAHSAGFAAAAVVASSVSLVSASVSATAGTAGPPGGNGGSGGAGGGGGGGGGSGKPAGGGWFNFGKKRKKGPQPVTLTLVSFAVSRKAYSRITKQFIRDYKERTGIDVGFRLSFGGSGTQARAVIDGLPADIAALSLPLDVMRIADAGLMRKDWRKAAPNNAVVATSVIAVVVRHGNPKNIQDWDDLIRDDVETVTANPKTAGVARWNFLALWGHRMRHGDRAALDYVTKVFERVPVQPRDAREASDVFYKQKTGDALLTYENEVFITNESQAEANRLPYVVPQNNVSIEFPIALIDRNIDLQPPEARAAAQAFIEYCFSPPAQREFAACGFRPIDRKAAKEFPLPHVKTQWTVEKKLAGWDATQTKFFQDQAILDKIQLQVGKQRVKDRALAKKQSSGWFSWWP